MAAVTVLVIWAASALDAIVAGQYEPLQYVTPVMLILAGALWGIELVRRNGRKNGDDDHPS